MPLATNPVTPAKSRSSSFSNVFEIWNRKLHYYLGLYFLFFLWLFAFTGLLLNHSWRFADFWPNRKVSKFQRAIHPPPPGPDAEQAKNVMGQLDIEGEIEWTTLRIDPGRLDFRTNRPGHAYQIKADLNQGLAEVTYDKLNAWGIMHVLHTFTGVRMTDPHNNRRDWTVTTVWALSMDAVAIGLIVMVLSSFYMWYGLKRKRNLGLVALCLGFLSCGLFVFGLRWLY
jgi:hypothetical protein